MTMPVDEVVNLARMTLQEVAILSAPILGLALLISLLINVVQVLTSLQDATISTVPRLIVSGCGLFLLMPWMWRHLCGFTIKIMANFEPYIR